LAEIGWAIAVLPGNADPGTTSALWYIRIPFRHPDDPPGSQAEPTR